MTDKKPPTPLPQKLPPGAGRGLPDSVPSELLLGEKTALKIRHNGEVYELRRTRQNKLILTK
jgi:hemin uptake protein HemP